MDPRTLFTSPYDQKTFTNFLKGFLGDEYQDEGRYENKEIGNGFEYLTHYSRLGSIELDNGGYKEQVLVLEITQKSISDARVSITKETIKLLKKDVFQGYYTVLVAFISDASPNNWRFSLIKSNDGKSWNNARRFSYYLGKNEGYKTPKQYLIDAEQINDLHDLVSRFDVEVVRKEFFNLYINLFLELYQEVKKYQYCFRSVNNGGLVDLVSFSKNLMGKMIFLYFIQKKGRLGLTDDENFKDHPGKHNFFKENFENQTLARDENLFHGGVNFYNDFLEPLFYSGLNKKSSNDWHEKLQMKVPYLNGGLFEEEYKDRETTPLPLENNLFKAIVDAFDTYNFTIDENDPMDQEIAVDPEMLGKIFEYMISINSEKIDDLVTLYNQKKKFKEYPSPDRSVNIVAEIKKNKEINKKLGAFYTPREIVQYMTREALIYSMIEFLSKKLTDKSREDLEVIVRELRHCKDKHLTTRDEIEDREGQVVTYQTLKSVAFDIKEYLLYDKNSEIKPLSILDPAVGSGAFPMGILQEMTGLVEYLIDTFGLEKKSRYEIKQSIIRDSIYGVDIDPGAVDIARLRFWLSLIVDANEPIPLPNLEFKFVCANSLIPLENDGLFTNKDVIEKLRVIKNEYFRTSDNDKKEELKTEFQTLKSDLLGFTHKMRNEFKSPKEYKKYILELVQQNTDAKNRQFQQWEPFDTSISNTRFDSEMMFDSNVFDIVIGNPPYITYKGKEKVDISLDFINKIKEIYISAEYKLNSYAIFVELGMKSLTNKGILSFIIPSTILQNEYLKNIRKYLLEKCFIYEIDSFSNKVFEGAVTDSIILFSINEPVKESKIKIYRRSDLSFDNSGKQEVRQNKYINNENCIMNLKTSEEGNILLDKIEGGTRNLGSLLKVNIGIKRAKAPISTEESEGYKKFIVGRDIGKYIVKDVTNFILFDTTLFHTTIDENIFLYNEKILVRKTGNQLICALDNQQYYTDQSLYNLYDKKNTGINLKYILGILNSSLINYYFNKKIITNPDIFPYIKGIHLEQMPIKDTTEMKKNIIIRLVNQIIDYKFIDKTVDTSEIERKIDILVYKLYELTLKDSQIIDPTLIHEERENTNFE